MLENDSWIGYCRINSWLRYQINLKLAGTMAEIMLKILKMRFCIKISFQIMDLEVGSFHHHYNIFKSIVIMNCENKIMLVNSFTYKSEDLCTFVINLCNKSTILSSPPIRITHFIWRPARVARNQHERGSKQSLLATCFMLISCLVYSLTLMMEMTCSSETSVDFQWMTQHYIPEDRILHNHWCENLKAYTDSTCSWLLN
jgi:hypothetical protein